MKPGPQRPQEPWGGDSESAESRGDRSRSPARGMGAGRDSLLVLWSRPDAGV